ncbi:phosphoadenosine phosphosulfate reductase domain-containing protein [Methanothermococcus okinawensis]|uniref:Phosphoadenosine phosphosulfate reductase n=1 Tax=Methanothermococcus okinawensis (strain DSM 14208 / JCM 11175 / IH1) TaxID=647113 RepID=F8AM42_METOI|nr:phosphoadenosine phosphosulfate reductase family protein [Methanothermococcus okinawensis]AEH06727.1 phosphoadenosine phosphosulfate reductase [Methanothermococcus okinawensis IH1]
MKTILGKIHLKWCKNCNVPVLDKKCGICGNDTTPVKLTPPADARPAFKEDIFMINNILKNNFGVNENIFKNKIVLINKIPGKDYMKEIIYDGLVFGILKYNEEIKEDNDNEKKWSIIPTVEGARRIINAGANKKIIVIKKDVVPFILKKHASVLRPGVLKVSEDIAKDDDIIILVENEEKNNFKDIHVLGVGRARMNYNEIINSEKGMVAKVRHAETPKEANYLKETGNFEESINKMIEANEDAINKFESNSVGFMRNTIKDRTNMPPVVAYSGGKDSLVVLLLAFKAFNNENINFEVLFTDTTLELPETLKNINDVETKYNINIIKAKSDDFWEKLEEYGPPGRDYRWCSEVCKMKPLEKIINNIYPNGCLTFVGLRKYESMNRSKKPRIWKSPHIEKQMLSAPILNWSAMHVWIYLFKNKAPYNKLYEKCFDRVGCYMCPAMELGEIELIKKLYPELWKKWEDFLINYAKRNNLDEKWVKSGWRWKYKN